MNIIYRNSGILLLIVVKIISVLRVLSKYGHQHWLWPGLLASLFIVFVTIAIFGALWSHASAYSLHHLLSDHYLWHVVSFTFLQALLSACLATLPAVALSRALYRCRLPGRALLLRFCAITLVLPVLVGVFGIMSVFGHHGWLAHLFAWLNLSYDFSLYGLGGILLAHVFFNLPLATRLLLQALESIPVEYLQLAAQLNMSTGQSFIIVEWPYLCRQLLSVTALVFTLCFSSFSTVLMLGGGPHTTTIELAIYQALSYDFDTSRAAMLALLQIFCCLGLVMVSQHFLVCELPEDESHHFLWRNRGNSLISKLSDSLIISVAMLFLLPPLLAVVVDGINPNLPIVLAQMVTWQALFTSIIISIISGLLCLLLTGMLLWSSRELSLRQHRFSAQLLDLSGILIPAMPSIVLTTGLFLLAGDNGGLSYSPAPIVILSNALMAIPYTLKVLESPMRNIAKRYNRLCLSLNITGFNRLRLVEWRALRRSVGRALAFACVLSLGDFGMIALFGNEDFHTLPIYLYQQIGSYRSQDGAVTALLLLLICLLLFSIVEKLLESNDKIR